MGNPLIALCTMLILFGNLVRAQPYFVEPSDKFTMVPVSSLLEKDGVAYDSNGKFTGVAVNAALRIMVHYEDGLMHGTKMQLHENGEIKCTSTYIYGNIHGLAVCFYDNGRLEAIISYENGKRQGFVKGWDTDGNLKFDYYHSDD